MSRMAATRDGYGQALLDLASNEKVVVLEADLGKSTNFVSGSIIFSFKPAAIVKVLKTEPNS